MPVPLYLSGGGNPAMAGSPSLILNPAVSGKHFETASIVNKVSNAVEYSRKKYLFSKFFLKAKIKFRFYHIFLENPEKNLDIKRIGE